MHAESVYLFRHALMRDAAYQLQMPAERSRLHALALDVLSELAGADAGFATASAFEIAEHAKAAQVAAAEPALFESLCAQEARWREKAARDAEGNLLQCLKYWQSLAAMPHASQALRAEALIFWARGQRLTGQPIAAGESLREAARLIEENSIDAHRRLLFLEQSELCSHMGKRRDARQLLHAAMDHARASKDAKAISLSALALAGHYLAENRFPECESLLAQAEASCAAIGFIPGHASCVGLRANMAYRRDNAQEAILGWQRCAALAAQSGQAHQVIVARGNIGSGLMKLGRFKEAAANYRQAIAQAESSGERMLETTNTINLGLSLFFCAEHGEARRCFEKGIALSRETASAPTLCNALTNLGKVQTAGGHHAEALVSFSEGALLASRIGLALDEAECRTGEGAMLFLLGSADAAIPKLRQAVALLDTCAGPADACHVIAPAWLAIALLKSGAAEPARSFASRAMAELARPEMESHPWDKTALGLFSQLRDLLGRR